MAGLDPAIQGQEFEPVLLGFWVAGSSPAMTK